VRERPDGGARKSTGSRTDLDRIGADRQYAPTESIAWETPP
jgi:hypothetical protein